MPAKNIVKMVTSCIDVAINNRTYGLLTKTAVIHQLTRIGERYMNNEFTATEASDELLKVLADYPPEEEHILNNRVRAEMFFDNFSKEKYVIYISRSDDNGKTWTRESVRAFQTIEEAEAYLLMNSTIEHIMLETEANNVHAS